MAQRAEKKPNPTNRVLDGKVAATGSSYPDKYFINPFNAGIDSQYGDESGHPNESRTLCSPTETPVGMGVLGLNGESDYDSNWETGVRGKAYKPKGPREGTRWTPRGGK